MLPFTKLGMAYKKKNLLYDEEINELRSKNK
jgi:hypothetical protein